MTESRDNDKRLHLPLMADGSISGRTAIPLAPPPLERAESSADLKAIGLGDESDEAALDDGLIQVGDLAKLCQKTVRALHLYEELGLLKPHARSKGRYRLFSLDAVVRVRWIGKLQELGLSLATIQSIVREWEASPSAPGAMAKMREIYRQKLASAREQIARLTALEAELSASLKYLETCDACDPALLIPACTCCERHEERRAPDLVAGFRASP